MCSVAVPLRRRCTLAPSCCASASCNTKCITTQLNPISMSWLQHLFSFCALALLLQISMFMLYFYSCHA